MAITTYEAEGDAGHVLVVEQEVDDYLNEVDLDLDEARELLPKLQAFVLKHALYADDLLAPITPPLGDEEYVCPSRTDREREFLREYAEDQRQDAARFDEDI